MIRPLALLLCLSAPSAHAGVGEVIEAHVLPNLATFSAETRALAQAADRDCTTDSVRPAYQRAFDAWVGVQHLAFGPLETGGRGLAISFWPDTRGMVPNALARLIADEDAAVDDPESFAEVSVAARGLFALEHLLWDEAYAGYEADSYECRLVTAIAADLARMAAAAELEWRQDEVPLLLEPGQGGNRTYLTEKEVQQQFYTAIQAGLEFDADTRLARPLGSFERPRPTRAEAWRSGRSLGNVILSLEALRDMSRHLADAPIPATEAAFDTAIAVAEELDDPVFAGVEDPSGRLKVEILQQRIDAIAVAVAGEIGEMFGVTQGFNSADGD